MNELMSVVMEIAGKKLLVQHVNGPEGVRGRNSDNTAILKSIGWEPTIALRDGMQ